MKMEATTDNGTESFRLSRKCRVGNRSICQPLVSCIVPSYMKFDYLYEALTSLVGQDYGRIEILVSDDGSEDFPKSEIEGFLKDSCRENIERWEVFHSGKNEGTVRNLNGAMRRANGSIFIILNADDTFYEETSISKVVRRLEETGFDMLACSWMVCTENLEAIRTEPTEDQILSLSEIDTPKKQYDAFVVRDWHGIATGAAMVYTRKNMSRMGLFDESYRQWEDGPRLVEYARRGATIPTAHDIVLVNYRLGGISNAEDTYTPTASAQMRADLLEYTRKVIIPDKKNPYRKRRREFMYWYYVDVAKTVSDKIAITLRFPIRTIRRFGRRSNAD